MTPGVVAIHEAGHVAVAWRCGVRPGPVTITPGRWGGLTVHGALPAISSRDLDRLDPDAPVPLWPATVRRSLDVAGLIAAGGQAAEEVFRFAGRAGDTIADQAEAVLAALPPPAAVTAKERTLLALGDESLMNTDQERLAELAAALHEDVAARACWLQYVAAQAAEIIRHEAPAVLRVAAALEEHRSLSGRAVRELLPYDGGARAAITRTRVTPVAARHESARARPDCRDPYADLTEAPT